MRLVPGLLFMMMSCIEPYTPPDIESIGDILVVDGFINGSDNAANVRLTQATKLSDGETSYPELNAAIILEEEDGATYPLTEEGNGNYSAINIPLQSSKRYRLRVTRANQKQYFSDYIEVKQQGSLDSITWQPSIRRDGINIYANAHHDDPNSRYYQWTYEETWEYTSGYYAAYRIVDGAVFANTENLYYCWTSKPSSEINIASSERLTENIVRNYPLVFIPKGSEKFVRKYSILVHQRSLSKEAYDFWSQLKKTTENLGTLFDPLPSQVTGNMHSQTDPNEYVLGYFSGGFVSKKRIFLELRDLPEDLRHIVPPFCPVDSIPVNDISMQPDRLLIGTYGMPFVEGYTFSEGGNCMNCRDNGGTNVRPDFWD